VIKKPERGGQGPIWAVEPLAGWLDENPKLVIIKILAEIPGVARDSR
jgi:hypothetical protein